MSDTTTNDIYAGLLAVDDRVFRGTAGNDTLTGTAGSDILLGGAGDDLYIVNDSSDVINERVLRLSLLSSSSTGVQANQSSSLAVFSPDGSKIAFASLATNLVSGDTNKVWDVFVKDLASGKVTRVSTNSQGQQGNNNSGLPLWGSVQFSPDGNRLLFTSAASNLVASDTNGVPDVFVKDLQTGAVIAVNTDSQGAARSQLAFAPAFSPDGQQVAFVSRSSSTAKDNEIYIKDLLSGTLTLASVNAQGQTAAGTTFSGVTPTAAVFSPDGSSIIFSSYTSNLVANDQNKANDIFLKNLQTGTVTRISTDSTGAEANASSYSPAISTDGTLVVFQSLATNLAELGPNTGMSLYVKNLQTGKLALVSSNSAGVAADGNSYAASLSPDGKKVVFVSNASNLVADITDNNAYNVYVKDLTTGQIIRISTDALGKSGTGYGSQSMTNQRPVFSPDGQQILFTADANGLVSADSTGYQDVFVRDLQPTDAGGIDTVQSSISYVLGDYLENLILTGTDNLQGTGNALDNQITGNSGNNTLMGGAGNDTLTGGAGDDVLEGGSGSDTYRIAVGDGNDLIRNHDESTTRVDTLKLTDFAMLGTDDIRFTRTGTDLVLTIPGKNQITLQNHYQDATWQIDRIEMSNAIGIVNHVDGSIDFTAQDKANQATWSVWHRVVDALGHVVIDDVTYDNGGHSSLEYDQANANSWQSRRTGWDAAGRVDWLQLVNDDGTFDQTDFDQAASQPWQWRNDHRNAAGQLDWVRTRNDDGSEDWLDLDQDATASWQQQNRHLDTAGRLDWLSVLNKDGSSDWQDEDQDNTHSWTRISSHLTADGQLNWRRYVNDDASEDWQELDLDKSQSWREKLTHKNAAGQETQETVIQDDGSRDITLLDPTNTQFWQQYSQHFNAANAYQGSDITLDDAVAIGQLWFSRVNNNLDMQRIDTGQHFQLADWFANTKNHGATVVHAANGLALNGTKIDALVAAMAAFAPPAAGTTNLGAAYQALVNLIAASWQ